MGPIKMPPAVRIVLLNWNQYRETKECLASLLPISYTNYRIILVDNGSTDGSADRLAAEFPAVKLIRNEQNLGFTGGNNVGLKAALNEQADYVLLLNNDTVVDSNFLSRLVEASAAEPKIGIVSPRIMYYNDHQRVWFAGGDYLPIIRKPFHTAGRSTESEWVSGCCLLAKRGVVDKIGLLDDDYFFNLEDVDFCRRAKLAGYKIKIIPAAVIYHKVAASTGDKYSPVYTYFRIRNLPLFFKKTGQWLPLVLSLSVIPLYALLDAWRNGKSRASKAIMIALRDFAFGKFGRGSIDELMK